MSTLVGAEGALLFSGVDGASKSIVTRGIADLVSEFAMQGWAAQNVRAARLLSSNHAGFLIDSDLFEEDELYREPMYEQFLRPRGFGFGAATAINIPSGEKIIFSIEKKLAAGPVGQPSVQLLNVLRPHLARSAMIAGRLAFERIEASIEALNATGLGSAILSATGKIIAHNTLFQNYEGSVVASAEEMARIVRDANLNSSSISFPLAKSEGQSPAVAHIIPVRGGARDIFTRASFFLLVTPVDRTSVVDAVLIQALFDLSPAETRVAYLLAVGLDTAAISKRLSISIETVRTHIKAILSKSEMKRQAEFVAAVASIRSPR